MSQCKHCPAKFCSKVEREEHERTCPSLGIGRLAPGPLRMSDGHIKAAWIMGSIRPTFDLKADAGYKEKKVISIAKTLVGYAILFALATWAIWSGK